jgi:hypothetical protein
MSDTNRQQIVHAITTEIMEAALSYDQEARHPGFDPDRMDDRLKHYKLLKDSLRRIRQELEELFAMEVL